MTTHQWDFADPYLWPVTVEAAHIDALAHTRNTHYVEWCMEAAWAHTTALGLGAEDYQRLDRAMALTHGKSTGQVPVPMALTPRAALNTSDVNDAVRRQASVYLPLQ